ncbi:hypothetical protein LHU53_00895 [Rhodoferax sp. U2-2l]|uniref:hypothetical protein n=1 Tax=Rhodoferax sp. U2-2l TaxID=2884000 RepID=UPI001D0AD2CE|nr:hypothetical protein [Rhodoferax sp. U2-2l]MCB8745459.1 hypothetical protein [Rhodoferax sp. U2-2l]
MSSATRIDQARRLGPRGRIVQHAILRTGAADEATALRLALEDALATADFGDCGRLVLVRRLQLHHLPRHAGPVLVARALEAAWRTLAAHALPHHHPQAAQAQAVFFASRFEARLAWLHQVAQDRPTEAWFWPAALPELAPGLPLRGQVSDVVRWLLQEAPEPARQALLCWRDQELVALAQAMQPATLDAWQTLLVAEPAGKLLPATKQAPHVRAAPPAAAALLATALQLGQVAPDSPSAAAWLAALWLAPALGRPPTSADVQQVLAIQVSPTTASVGPAGTTHGTSFYGTVARPQLPGTERAPPATGAAAAALAALPGALDVSSSDTPARGTAPPSATPPTDHLPDQRASVPPTQPPHPVTARARPTGAISALPWLAAAQPSAHAGLLLLLNLLRVLRFDTWLQAQPVELRQPFVQTLLTDALDQSGAPAHDPQRDCLIRTPADNITLPTGRVDGVRWSLPAALRLWRLRLRRALRQHAGLDLADVVRRTGWVSATATHLDVLYPLDEVELRLRRLGLDSDPGWVPWFGRIVAFHFVSRERLPADDGGAHG